MFDSILVPTDGSECAEVAIGYAEDLAERYEATVHVLCVVDSRSLDTDTRLEQVQEESTEIVTAVHDRLAGADIPVEDAVRTGVPHQEILDYATQQDTDLVAMGTHGRTGVERFLLGSVTEKVVRQSEVPVLTVRAENDETVTYPYSDILIPTDGSEQAAGAIDVGVDITSTYQARLHAVSVINSTSFGVDVRSADIFEVLDEAAQTAVETVANEATEASVSALETAVKYGNPYREIRSYIDEHDIDLVVMGTHGRSGLERYLLGSVTEKIVRTSPVPVLTVRSTDSAPD
ncbi:MULTISPECIES: universal stress protein [Halobacterium]|uniref:universal stress protein n=1 Tax=Halobacterium TaxID=2239 RepID=UPI00073E5C54|nr:MULTISPECIES: universal stress protein [Halobacterium]MCG1003142.1 universal stress protein [Halobacterium noricense]